MPTKIIEFGPLYRELDATTEESGAGNLAENKGETLNTNLLYKAENVYPDVSGGYKPTYGFSINEFTGATADQLAYRPGIANAATYSSIYTYFIHGGSAYYFLNLSGSQSLTKITGTSGIINDVALWGNGVKLYSGSSGLYASLLGVNSSASIVSAAPAGQRMCIVKDFLILANKSSFPNRFYNSAINDYTSWTAGENLSDYTDIQEMTQIKGVVGGEYLTVFGTNEVAIFHFVNSDTIWEKTIIATGLPYIYGYHFKKVNGMIYFPTLNGLYRVNGGAVEKVSDTRAVSNGRAPQYIPEYDSLIFNVAGSMEPVYTGLHLQTNQFYTLSSGTYSGDKLLGFFSTDRLGHNIYYDQSENKIHAGPFDQTTLNVGTIGTSFHKFENRTTIQSIELIGGEGSSAVITVSVFDEMKDTPDSTTNVTLNKKTKCRITGKYFKFELAITPSSDKETYKGLSIEYTKRGDR